MKLLVFVFPHDGVIIPTGFALQRSMQVLHYTMLTFKQQSSHMSDPWFHVPLLSSVLFFQ